MLRNAELLWGQQEASYSVGAGAERPALKDVLDLPPELWPTRPAQVVPAQAAIPTPALEDAPRGAGSLADAEPDGKPAILGAISVHSFPHDVVWTRVSADGYPHVVAPCPSPRLALANGTIRPLRVHECVQQECVARVQHNPGAHACSVCAMLHAIWTTVRHVCAP